MKWFKHQSAARKDERIAHLEQLAGLEGYGFYFKLLEVVAEAMDCGNKCSLNYPLKTWSHVLHIHHNKFSKLLSKCEVTGLVTVKYNEGKGVGKGVGSSDVRIEVIIPNLLKYRDNHTKNLQATYKQEVEVDKEEEVEEESEKEKEEVIEKNTHSINSHGEICKALTRAGLPPFNQSHQTFLAVIESGATSQEFYDAAIEAKKSGQSKFNFNYVVSMVKGRRLDAKNLQLHKGAMPAMTNREAGRQVAAQSIFTPENTKHLQGNKPFEREIYEQKSIAN